MSAAVLVGATLGALFDRGALPLRVVSRARTPWTWQETHYESPDGRILYAFHVRRWLRSGVFSADYTQPEFFNV